MPIPRFLQTPSARYNNYKRRIWGVPLVRQPANLAAVDAALDALLAQIAANRRLSNSQRRDLRILAELTRKKRKGGNTNTAQANRLVAQARAEVEAQRNLNARVLALRLPSPPRGPVRRRP